MLLLGEREVPGNPEKIKMPGEERRERERVSGRGA
jgi:hypothetical protein